MPTTILRTRDGVLDAADQAALADLAQRLSKPGAKLWLHLHGGLVDQAKGEALAARLSGAAPDGFGLGADWEQVYVVWRTGAFETLKANWTELFENDRLYKALLKKLLEFAADKLGLPGAAGRSVFTGLGLTPTEIAARLERRPDHDPFGDVDLAIEVSAPEGRGPSVVDEADGAVAQEFMLLLQHDLAFNQAADDIAAALTVEPETGRSLSPRGDPTVGAQLLTHLDLGVQTTLQATTPPDQAARLAFTGFEVAKALLKHGGRIAIRVIRRFRTRRDHGFYPTVVEELVRELYGDLIGAAVWGFMKTDAGDHFAANGLGRALLEGLRAADRVVVSAHSAGSIWASELLLALADAQPAPRIRMALLAPAVRMDLFARAVARGGHMVESLRIYTMRDELERKDPVLGERLAFIYPASLLYLVSGVFEDLDADAFPDAPLLGMQRFLADDVDWLKDADQIAAVGAAMAFIGKPANRLILATVDGGPGLSSQATSHGDFDQDHATLASVVRFLG
jgi:hypothetical protein